MWCEEYVMKRNGVEIRSLKDGGRVVPEDLFPVYVFIETDQPENVYRELKRFQA